jgi:hypothetical protein
MWCGRADEPIVVIAMGGVVDSVGRWSEAPLTSFVAMVGERGGGDHAR